MTGRFRAPVLFGLVCVIWGLSWMATAIGVREVPPLFFAGSRFVVAGVLMLALHRMRSGTVRIDNWARLAVVGFLGSAVTNGLMFWAVQHLDSGVGAVMNMSLIPLLLLVIGVLYGQERFTVRGLGGIALGFAGLYLLFPPAGPRFADPMALTGAVAIFVGTVCYAWGAILSRPLLTANPPMLVGGYVALAGGIILVPISLLVEPDLHLDRFMEPKVMGAWLFMVLAASLIAYTSFLALLRDWGPARTGLYCYISPVIAVIAGAVFLGERITMVDVAGFAILLLAAWLAGSGRPGYVPPVQGETP